MNPKTLAADTAQILLGKQIEREYSLFDLLRRPEVSYRGLMSVSDGDGGLLAGPGLEDAVSAEQVELQAKYAGYVTRQQEEVDRQAALESQPIPAELDYDSIASLSFEVRQRLKAARPETVGQAGRVSGVTPAAISLLLVHLKRLQYGKKAA